MKREDILEKALEAVTGQREEDYGTPKNNFSEISDLWNTAFSGKLNSPLDAKDVALAMILLKVARLTNSTSNHDSWLDIAGYAACGSEVCSGNG